ncbi:hypothetical protein [Microvirga mediterraneensis]|uniref:Uncharacterized protein n=1 Tax=Microvirga mediterraneensis TaxID=2754695 RepID=A0A838BG98_9HYPH|nr:hypothetical protein [Microvirga mediterraneensis]MBA1154598.1 hypothetical protein [Microvirga mediterraneensis]
MNADAAGKKRTGMDPNSASIIGSDEEPDGDTLTIVMETGHYGNIVLKADEAYSSAAPLDVFEALPVGQVLTILSRIWSALGRRSWNRDSVDPSELIKLFCGDRRVCEEEIFGGLDARCSALSTVSGVDSGEALQVLTQ